MESRHSILTNNKSKMLKAIEYLLYSYIVFMFLTKGEGVRNLTIFGGFALWLLSFKKDYIKALKHPVSILFGLYLLTILISVFFSIDKVFSFKELRGDPVKALILFPMFATVMSDEKRLLRLCYVASFMALVMVTIGYYSYIFHDIPLLKPDTPLMHAWHNKFARYLNTFHPFLFTLFFVSKKKSFKTLIVISLIYTVSALLLSTSREGYLAFFAIIIVWIFYLSKLKKLHLTKAISALIILSLVSGLSAWYVSPYFKERLLRTIHDIKTLNDRTKAWIPAIHAIDKRPLFGWGYGEKIFHRPEPYKGTNYSPPELGSHNTFLRVVFHQGLLGLSVYVILLFTAIKVFLKGSFKDIKIANLILLSVASVLIGNYILNALLADLRLKHLAVVLGIGLAAKSANENRHN